ncbi:hypothetical protein Tco_1430776 [Tanacetum coccineum]
MTTLKFADTHNMVAFLAKPAVSEGFEQVVDFLNAHTIKYALTINPIIYTSCIEHFWAAVKAKTINGEVHLQALVDEKKIIITESIQCLSSKTTAWNKFSSTMASAIICLAISQKFVQVIVNQQLEGMPTHKRIYIAPSHTKKIFGNMRRVGKGFSGRETLLFQTMVVQDQAKMGEGSAIPTDPHHRPTIIQPLHPQTPIRIKSLRDEDSSMRSGDSLVRAATTTTSLDAEQDKGSGPRCQETMGDTIAQTRFENVSKHSNDPLLARGNTLRSGEDSLKLNELMELCTNLQQRVLDLETTKTTQATEIASLKRRVKKLERMNKSRTHGLKRLYRVGSSRRVESSEDEGLGEEDASKQGRIADIDANEDIYLVNVQTDEDMFGVNDLDGDECCYNYKYNNCLTDVEMMWLKHFRVVKSANPRDDKVKVQDKSKGKMVESEPMKKMSKKELLRLDEELAFKLQAEEEEERLAREKAQQVEEANIAWDDVQAKINADYQLAQRLQAQEQDELTAKRAVENENRPQKDSTKRESVDLSIKHGRMKTIKTELVEESFKKAEIEQEESLKKAEAEIAQESSLKRAGEELEQESSKKQKLEEDKESEELKQYLQRKEESYFQIIRADTNSHMYLTFGKMLKTLTEKTFHCVTMQSMPFYLLVEKMYPLTNHTLHQMFNDVKLQVDYECEMAFELLRLGRIVGIKSLLEVNAAKLMLLVYKLLLLLLKVNAASTKVTTAQRLRLLKELLLSEENG